MPPLSPSSSSSSSSSASLLFESRTIADIRLIEKQTRDSISSKSLALRSLLGDSYRDLLKASDLIGHMKTTALTISSGVSNLDKTFVDMQALIAADQSSSDSSPFSQSKAARGDIFASSQIYTTGSQIKMILDTPEVLYGSLDEKDVKYAARRFMASEVVHACIMANAKEITQKKFPLVEHQWPLVAKFKHKVIEAAALIIAEEEVNDMTKLADAVIAEALLLGEQAAQTLARFLKRRENAIIAAVKKHQLRTALTLAQRAIVSARALFLGDGVGGAPLVGASTNDSLANVLFAGVPDPSGTLARAWASACRRSAELLAPLPPEEVARAADAWIDRLAKGVAKELPSALAFAKDAAELADVEAEMRSATHRDAGSGTSNAVYTAGDAAFLSAGEALLGRPLDMFEELFDAPFVAACASLTQRNLASAWQEVASEGVESAVTAAAQEATPFAGRFDPVQTTANARQSSSSTSSSSSPLPVAEFEARLAAAGAGSARLLARLNMQASQRRAAKLAPAVASAAEEAAEAALKDVAARVEALSSSFSSSSVLPALALARVCDALVASPALAELLGPHEVWGEAAAASSGSSVSHVVRRLSGKPVPAVARWASKFGEVALAARALWSGWVVAELRESIVTALTADQSLASEDTPRSWEPASDEDTVLLPAHISPPSADMAFAACREAARAASLAGPQGAKSVAVSVARLGDELSSAFLEAVMERVSASPPLGEKGVVQMLFDVFAVLSLLAPPPGTPAPADDAARRSVVGQALRALSSRLDPIDWATYEPLLWMRGAAAIKRVKGLLSLRGGSRSAHVGSGVAPEARTTTSVDAHNIVCASTPAPRFALLPVSAPAAAVAEARAATSAAGWADAALLPDEWRAGGRLEGEDAEETSGTLLGSSLASGPLGLTKFFKIGTFAKWGL